MSVHTSFGQYYWYLNKECDLMKKIFAIILLTLPAAFLTSSCHPDKEDAPGSSSQETPPIVSQISSVVSPPVYEESSAEESSSEIGENTSSQAESKQSSSSMFAAE